MRNHKLEGKDLVALLGGMIFNQWQEIGFYELLSAELVRREKELSLFDISHALFKLTLVGVESSQLRSIAFIRAGKEYATQLKRLQEERMQYLPSKDSEILRPLDTPSTSEVALQESLLLLLWSYVKQAKEDSQLDLDKLLLLMPKQVLSTHILIN